MLFNRSVPIYKTLKPQSDAFRHIVIINYDKTNWLKYSRIFRAQKKVTILIFQNTKDSGDLCESFCSEDIDMRLHTALESLLEDIVMILNNSRIGDYYYLSGDESFIWNIVDIAKKYGIEDGFINLSKYGNKKNVYCSHCHAINICDDCNILNCNTCGSKLLVRKHFSRSLGAYLGVFSHDMQR